MPDAPVADAKIDLRTKEGRAIKAAVEAPAVTLLRPHEFAELFFGNNPLLTQLMGQQGQPNVESAAADLCVRAYRSYLLACSQTYFAYFKTAYPDVNHVPNPATLLADYAAATGA